MRVCTTIRSGNKVWECMMKHGYDCPECPMFVGSHCGDVLRPNIRSYPPKIVVVGEGQKKQECGYCGKLLNPLSIPAHERKCKEKLCVKCRIFFRTRDARLLHELSSHLPLEEPWPVHLRPLLSSSQRGIVAEIIGGEGESWERELILEKCATSKRLEGAVEWKLDHQMALWLANTLATRQHPELPSYYGGKGLEVALEEGSD